MTRQEHLQLRIFGEALEAAGIPYRSEQGRRKHRVVIAGGRSVPLAGSPSCDDAVIIRDARRGARKLVEQILADRLSSAENPCGLSR